MARFMKVATFRAPLSNGGEAKWTAEVVRTENGVAYVRHPERARNLPFSPVAEPGLYKYPELLLAIKRVPRRSLS